MTLAERPSRPTTNPPASHEVDERDPDDLPGLVGEDSETNFAGECCQPDLEDELTEIVFPSTLLELFNDDSVTDHQLRFA